MNLYLAFAQNIKHTVSLLRSKFNVIPKLVVVEVGEDEASLFYMKQKHKFSKCCDIPLHHLKLSSEISESTLLDCVEKLNNDPSVHGITVQLPMHSTAFISTSNVLNSIAPNKDVEGLGFFNTALLSREDIICSNCGNLKQRTHVPCTALACLAFIKHLNYPLAGSHCVVVGNGRLVGAPTAELFGRLGRATVTQCHQYTSKLEEEIGRGDVVISAVGLPELIKGVWIKEGAVILDCGYSVISDSQHPTRLKCVGDVEFRVARDRAKWITPVPGGIGPVSVAMLFNNTLNSTKWSLGLEDGLCLCQHGSTNPQSARLSNLNLFEQIDVLNR